MNVLTPLQLTRRRFLRLARVTAGSALLASCAEVPPTIPTQEAKAMNARVLCDNFLGFGAQGDFFLTLPPNAGRGVKEQDIELVFARVRAMRPRIVRTFFNFDWWEPIQGKPTPDSPEMRDYVRWARFLSDVGCALMLMPWGDTFAYSYWMRTDRQTRLPAHEQRPAMVRSFVDLVDYLHNRQALTNLRYLCLMNEPDNDPARRVPVGEFVALYRALDRTLRARGLRDAVQLVGIDGSNWALAGPGEWFHDVVSEGLDYADAVASHTYGHRDTMRLVPWIRSRTDLLAAEAREPAVAGHSSSPRPLMITEFNSYGDTFTNPENHTYDHGLFLADFAITALQHGVASVLMWCLMDTWYDDNHKQQYGLWRFRNEGWEPRPGFYSWSLITRFTRPGSRVVAAETEADGHTTDDWPAQSAVGLVDPDGRLTLLTINRSATPARVRLEVPGIDLLRTLHVYAYTELRVHEVSSGALPGGEGGMLPAADSVAAGSSEGLTYEMPARSFIVFTEAR